MRLTLSLRRQLPIHIDDIIHAFAYNYRLTHQQSNGAWQQKLAWAITADPKVYLQQITFKQANFKHTDVPPLFSRPEWLRVVSNANIDSLQRTDRGLALSAVRKCR